MALTFVGAVSVAEAGRAELHAMYVAALGCNLAWGLVDAVMYLVRTITARGRSLTLVRGVQFAVDAAAARDLIRAWFAPVVASLVSDGALDSIRERMLAMSRPHDAFDTRSVVAAHGCDPAPAASIMCNTRNSS
jgi:hypothetical protein